LENEITLLNEVGLQGLYTDVLQVRGYVRTIVIGEKLIGVFQIAKTLAAKYLAHDDMDLGSAATKLKEIKDKVVGFKSTQLISTKNKIKQNKIK
jgi:hypothetical protein